MSQSEKKVLPFPEPREQPAPSTITVQIGNERFAIHWEIEELPPAVRLIRLKRAAKKGTPGS